MKKALFYWFAFLGVLLFMTSCGARKKQSSEAIIEKKVEAISTDENDLSAQDRYNVKESNEVVYNGETVTTISTYTPIDPTQKSIVIDADGKVKEFNNTTYKEEKITSKTSNAQKSSVGTSSTKNSADKSKSFGTIKSNDLDSKKSDATDRHAYKWWHILWLIIPVVLYIIWKNRDKLKGIIKF